MGGAVSSGENNDALIDNLLEADYIKNHEMERVFRAVDRATYYVEEARDTAYRDLAWKHGNLHLSAPCIYAQVMDSLDLKPGLSFLNLGSGTGYLSTMVGLVVGSKGINHGIEYHKDVVEYAEAKVAEFMKTSTAIDEYDFCKPKFVLGNCLELRIDGPRYDRVYCGAGCPEAYNAQIRSLLAVGGVLVMPMNEQLLQIRRLSETEFDVRPVLPVSFASLILPRTDSHAEVHLPPWTPLTLQQICRSKIRSHLKECIDAEHPGLWQRSRKHPRSKRHMPSMRRVVWPVFGDSDSDTASTLPYEDRDRESLHDESTERPERPPRANRERPEGRLNQPREETVPASRSSSESSDVIDKDLPSTSSDPSNETADVVASTSAPPNGQTTEESNPKREKLDSGMVEGSDRDSPTESVPSEMHVDEQEDSDTDSEEEFRQHPHLAGREEEERRRTLGGGRGQRRPIRFVASRTFGNDGTLIVFESSELDNLPPRRRTSSQRKTSKEEESKEEPDLSLVATKENYSYFMRLKLQQLPLPPFVKSFLNYFRDFE